MADRSTSRKTASKPQPAAEPAEPAELSDKDRVNAKQARLEAERAERARALEAGEIEADVPEGRRSKVVDGVKYVLVNGGWIRSEGQ